ncbi:MAG TPA: hypothetical protein VGR78_19635, partial [Verrucomicrobiae bacterium]|nr:hypothetical protein [Verrucomicrobiae bacterium]
APASSFLPNTSLKETRAPDHGDIDILELVLPATKKRGLKAICSCEDVWTRSVPNVEPTLEIDLKSREAGTQCLLNPDVRNFWRALVTDYCKSYPVDGILFFNERNGPLLNALGASHAQSIASGRVPCFCPLHQEAARQRGLDFERVREGYEKLDAYIQNSLAGRRPTDGYFVEFWRLLVNYPEIIAWERLFDEGKHQVLASIYATVKAINNDLQVGFHIEQVSSILGFIRILEYFFTYDTNCPIKSNVPPIYINWGRGRAGGSVRTGTLPGTQEKRSFFQRGRIGRNPNSDHGNISEFLAPPRHRARSCRRRKRAPHPVAGSRRRRAVDCQRVRATVRAALAGGGPRRTWKACCSSEQFAPTAGGTFTGPTLEIDRQFQTHSTS